MAENTIIIGVLTIVAFLVAAFAIAVLIHLKRDERISPDAKYYGKVQRHKIHTSHSIRTPVPKLPDMQIPPTAQEKQSGTAISARIMYPKVYDIVFNARMKGYTKEKVIASLKQKGWPHGVVQSVISEVYNESVESVV